MIEPIHSRLIRGLSTAVLCSLMVLGFGVVPCAHGASTNTLAWYESFETLTNGFVLNGTNHLYSAVGGSATASVSSAESSHGTNSCYVPVGAVLSNVIDNSSSVVWADMFAQVTLSDNAPAVDSTLSSMFYFDANSNAVVQDGPTANWVTLSNNVANVAANPVVTGVWTRITVVHNYSDKTWALIVNDELLDDDIGFINTGATKMNSMIVSNDTYLDALVFDTTYPVTGRPLAASVSSATLPWYDSFEDYADGTDLVGLNFMNTTGGTLASAQTVDPGSYDGTNLCFIPDQTTLSNTLDSGSATNVWVDMFVKVVTRDEAPDVDATLAVQFYFDANLNAVVQDGPTTNWVTLTNNLAGGTATLIDTGAWTRISIAIDYGNTNWQLTVNDEVLTNNIEFIDTGITKMTSLIVSNQCYLDQVLVDVSAPSSNVTLAGDADADGMPDYWEIDYFEYAYVQGAGGDYDQDGRSSVSEYAKTTDPTDANDVSIDVPFRDGFESASVGSASGTWRGMANVGEVTVQTSETLELTKALSLSTGSVNVVINDATATNVWVHCYAKPQAHEGTPTNLTVGQVAGYVVMTNGDLLAWNSTYWATCDVSVATDQWMGFAVHLNYADTNYDLYVSTNATFGANMRHAHTSLGSLGFRAGGGSSLTQFSITNETTDLAYLDLVAVSHAYTNTGVAVLTNLVAQDRFAGTWTDAVRPPFNYDATDDLLDGKVGTDLMRELVDDDKLKIPTGGVDNVYYVNSSSWQWESGEAIANLHLEASMGMEIFRQGGVDLMVFYPYSNIVTLADTTIVAGWNKIAIPEPRIASDAWPLGFGMTNAAVQDMIFKNNQWIYYDGAKWKKSGNDSDMVLSGSFYYYHRSNGMTWATSEF